MAHKKEQGSTRNGHDSNAKRRGIKAAAGQVVTTGSILVRQCGTKWALAKNVAVGRDYTLYAQIDGVVSYRKGVKTYVSVLPSGDTEIGDALLAQKGVGSSSCIRAVWIPEKKHSSSFRSFT